MLTFVSVEPSPTILLIDRSEPIFESHTEGKIRNNMEILTFFAKSDSKLFHPDHENER